MTRIRNSAPIDPTARLAQQIKALQQQVADLERRASQRPAAIGWGKPAGGAVKVTSAHNGISAATDVTGLTVTWTAVSGREYRISASVVALQNTSAGIVDIRIATSGGTTVAQSSFVQAASGYATHTPWTTLTGLSGSVTYKVRAATTAGTVDAQMASPTPGMLLVEDIGPG